MPDLVKSEKVNSGLEKNCQVRTILPRRYEEPKIMHALLSYSLSSLSSLFSEPGETAAVA